MILHTPRLHALPGQQLSPGLMMQLSPTAAHVLVGMQKPIPGVCPKDCRQAYPSQQPVPVEASHLAVLQTGVGAGVGLGVGLGGVGVAVAIGVGVIVSKCGVATLPGEGVGVPPPKLGEGVGGS